MGAVAGGEPGAVTLTAPRLIVGGETFECVPAVPQWQIMKLAKAYASDDIAALAGMFDFLQKLVAPHEWDRFDTFMETLDLERAELDEAIGNALAEMGGRGKATEPLSGPSSAGSETPETPHEQVAVSFSRGTVERSPVEQARLSEAAQLLSY